MELFKTNTREFSGTLTVGGMEFNYDEYKTPLKTSNYRTVVLYMPGDDAVMVEFDANRDALQNVAEDTLRKEW